MYWEQIIYLFIQIMKILVFIIVLYLSSALHTHRKNDHLLKDHNQHIASSVDILYFEDEFTNLENTIDYIYRALTKTNTQKMKFLIGKVSEMRKGFSQLKGSLLSHHLPVTPTSKLCPGITTFNRTQLRKYIVSIELSQKNAVEYLSICTDCSFVADQLRQVQDKTQTYIRNLNKTLDGFYCEAGKASNEIAKGLVDLSNSYFKCNLRAKNWYYGSTTASDYKIYIFKRSATYNLTSCPLNAPFVKDNEQSCFDCPEGTIFNLGSRKCDTCKSNQILNMQSGQCDRCLGEKHFINGSLVCRLCVLTDGQLFNETNGKCYKCGTDSYLDTDKLICVKIACQAETPRFNFATKKCEACNFSEIIDPNDVTKCIKTNYIGVCPPSTPFYDAKAKNCKACPENTIYLKSSNECALQKNSTSLP